MLITSATVPTNMGCDIGAKICQGLADRDVTSTSDNIRFQVTTNKNVTALAGAVFDPNLTEAAK